MSESRRFHLETLNLRLKGYDQASAAVLARDLPAALAREFDGTGATAPRTLAEEVAVEIASQLRSHRDGEG